jgi:hypothetical protein
LAAQVLVAIGELQLRLHPCSLIFFSSVWHFLLAIALQSHSPFLFLLLLVVFSHIQASFLHHNNGSFARSGTW